MKDQTSTRVVIQLDLEVNPKVAERLKVQTLKLEQRLNKMAVRYPGQGVPALIKIGNLAAVRLPFAKVSHQLDAAVKVVRLKLRPDQPVEKKPAAPKAEKPPRALKIKETAPAPATEVKAPVSAPAPAPAPVPEPVPYRHRLVTV